MLKNCDACNRVFAHATRRLCEDCFEKEQKSFTAVKEYLQQNPGATVAEVAQKTEVDLESIYEYLREGRLSVIPSDGQLFCEICDAEISSGRVCAKCRSQLKKSSYEPPQPQSKPQSTGTRVHYLDQIRGRR